MAVIDTRHQMPSTIPLPSQYELSLHYTDTKHPGRYQAKLFLLEIDGRHCVYFVDVNGSGSDIHGSWHSWYDADARSFFYCVSFHYLGSRGMARDGARSLTFRLVPNSILVVFQQDDSILFCRGDKFVCVGSNQGGRYVGRVCMSRLYVVPSPPPIYESEWTIVPSCDAPVGK